MSAVFNLAPIPADPLLGLMTAFREDQRQHKIDLGVGVYRDETGATPIMKAVHLAEQKLLKSESTKVYEGPRGNPGFCDQVEALIFGDSAADQRSRITSLVTPGGCGALYLAIQLAKRATDPGRVWISNPSWPNHQHMVTSAGLVPTSYRYLDPLSNGLDFAAMMEDLSDTEPGDLVLIQGPCHNPSGVDLSAAQWRELATLGAAKGFLPLIDIAYHGLGDGLEADLDGVREALAILPEALISYSCSKNFGLYRERVGCLIVVAKTVSQAQAAGSHAASISRACYSMPPSHGAAIVDTILRDKVLRTAWEDELSHMRARIQASRKALSAALTAAFANTVFDRISNEKGMFSLIPIGEAQAAALAKNHAIYLPGSGRLNIAGVLEGDAETFARAYRSVRASD